MLNSAAQDRHDKAHRAWWRWHQAKRTRERDIAIFELWSLCEPEVWHAVEELARKLGDATGRHITVPEWLLRHGLAEDEVRHAAFPAVAKAAKGYDPYAGASFPTYAYSFIIGELRSSITTGDALRKPEQVAEQVRKVRQAGVDHIFFQLFDFTDLQALQLLAQTVVPAVRSWP